MPKRIFQSAAAVLTIVVMAALTTGCGQSPEPSSAVTPSPSATATVYPVPGGCPPAKELGQAYPGKEDLFTAIDAKLLDSEVKTALPKNGCAYLYGDVGTSNNSSEKFQHVMVWYFNTNRPGQAATADISAWAKSAGGTPTVNTNPGAPSSISSRDFDLPDTFSGWMNSTVVQEEGAANSFPFDQSVIPAFTQGNQSKIYFAVKAEKAQAILRASGAGAGAGDPTKALSQGLIASFSASTVVTDDQGYTAQLNVKGKLEPFVKNVTDAPPGKLYALSNSTVAGSITNKTAGRQTKTPSASVIAVYPLGSAACANNNGISVKNANSQKPSYCAIDLGSVEGVNLSPDASQTLKESAVPQKMGTFPESGDAIAQLNSPVSVYLYFGSWGATFTDINWHGDKGCKSQRASGVGSWYVAMDGWPDVVCQ